MIVGANSNPRLAKTAQACNLKITQYVDMGVAGRIDLAYRRYN